MPVHIALRATRPQRRFRSTLVASTLLTLLLVAGSALPARGDDAKTVILVPQEAVSISIDKTMLPSADHDAMPEIVSWSSPSRGALDESPTHFTYSPHAGFRDHGSDSFRFRYAGNLDIETATVFLIADLLSIRLQGDGDGGDHLGETTAGGDTVLVLDIGNQQSSNAPAPDGPSPHDSGGTSTEVARAVDSAGHLHVTLILDTGSRQARALIPQVHLPTGETKLLPAVALTEGPQTLEIDWWEAYRPTHNGGLLVRRNGQLMAYATGLDLHVEGQLHWTTTSDTETPPRFTVHSASSGQHRVAAMMAFPPAFADTFEDGAPVGWDPIVGPPQASGTSVHGGAAVDGGFGLEVDLAASASERTLSHGLTTPVDHVRVRFDLRLDAGCTASRVPVPNHEIVLLTGKSADVDTIFEVAVVPQGGGTFTVRTRLRDDLGTWRQRETSHPQVGEASIDVEWWSAKSSAVDFGGLVLRLDGALHPSTFLASLNREQKIRQLAFGATTYTFGFNAQLCLDEVEVFYDDAP